MADCPEPGLDARTALVVEDFVPFRRVLAKLLAGDGWNVLEARSARQGLALARCRRPDVVIVDWILGPGGSGIDVLRRLRRAGKAAPKVIVVSAMRDHADDEATALAAGAALFFSKIEVVSSGVSFLRHLDALCRLP